MLTLNRRDVLGAATGALALPLIAPRPELHVSAQDDRAWPTDGWETVAPDEIGVDPAVFEAATTRIQSETPTLSALVVAVGGRLAFEYYADGFADDDTTDIWSSTKSVTSAVIGIAIGDGLLALDDRIGDLLGDRLPADADPATADITVRDLLTMSSGWDWDGTVDYANLDNTDDWTARTLSLPIVAAPGEAFTYNSGNCHVMSVIIQTVSGQTLREFAQERLFGPIGIEISDWLGSPQDETAGGWGLFLTPREMASFGYLMLNGGIWDGEQIVPADWVAESTRFQIAPSPTNDFGGGTGYGYYWWLDEVAGYPAWFSLGFGESSIYVVPKLDLVMVAATAEVPALDQPDLQTRPRPIMRETIAPGVAGRA